MSLRMLTFAAVSLLPLSAQAQSHPPIVVTDPNAVVLGRTLTQWTALWLQWAFATPASTTIFAYPVCCQYDELVIICRSGLPRLSNNASRFSAGFSR